MLIIITMLVLLMLTIALVSAPALILKLALSHAAVRAVQHYPVIKRFYQTKARQKNPAIARTLVQKEIARAVYVVLHQQVDFNHTFKGQPLSKKKAAQWPRRASPDV